MTIEEKARAYDEALKKAKEMHEMDYTDSFTKANLEDLFPTLKESEDEKMRKMLIDRIRRAEELTEELREWLLTYLEKQREQNSNDVKREWWNKGYLEGRKNAHIPARELGLPSSWDFQKEQKPVLAHDENGDVMLSDFEAALFSAFSDAWQSYLNGETVNVAEWAKEHAPELLRVAVKPVEWSEEDYYLRECLINTFEKMEPYNKTWAGMNVSDIIVFLKSLYPHLTQEWSEEDEKPFNDALSGLKYAYEDLNNNRSFGSAKDIKEAFDWMQARVKNFRPQPKQEWGEKGEKLIRLIISILEGEHPNVFWRSNEMGSGVYTEELVDFFKSLRPQPKPAWSEEDEEMTMKIDCYLSSAIGVSEEERQNIEKWLKSLRPSWKPSEEQMGALHQAWYLCSVGAKTRDLLESLYNDLMKRV